MESIRTRAVPWLLGFFLVANTFLVPNLSWSPRATDLIGLLLAVWLLHRAAVRGLPAAPLAVLAVANLLPLVWLVLGLLDRETETVTQAVRWLVAVPWAMTLLLVLAEAGARRRFLWGLLAGCLVNAAVVVLQFAGFDPYLRLIGFSTGDSAFHHYVYHQVRIPGLHGHHNASSAVISLLVPVSLYLYFRREVRLWVPALGLLLMFVALHLTSTRSPLVVAFVTLGLAILLAREVTRAAAFVTLLLAVGILFLAVMGPPGGAVRWGDLLAIEANAGERVESNRLALELSASHPFGLGVQRGKEEMVEASTIEATHNALLQASLFFGGLLALVVLAALLYHVLRLLQGARSAGFLAGLLAVHLLGLFMFEEHLSNPTFVILASWLVASAAARWGRRPEDAAEVAAMVTPPQEPAPTGGDEPEAAERPGVLVSGGGRR
ncbi:MAG: O-antigen ligase family protein [Candidatus Krumholzibacteriia bacterium]